MMDIIWIISALLVLPSSLYLFVFATLSWLAKKPPWKKSSRGEPPATRVNICVPCFGNDATAINATKLNLKLLQASQLTFTYTVLSDHQNEETQQALKALGAEVFEVILERSTKAKALNQYFNMHPQQDGFIFLLDIDNLLTEASISAMAYVLGEQSSGKAWYQFERISANQDSAVAVLDTWSECVNNNVFRKGCQVLGVAPALIGSGILAPAKDYVRLNQAVPEYITGGFDKWLDHALLQERIPVMYLEGAHIKDEKISDLEQLQRQRTRWISAQIFIAKKLLKPMIKALFLGKFLRVLKYAQLYIVPRVWHMALSVFLTLIALFFANKMGQYLLLGNMLILVLGLLLASRGMNLYHLAKAIFKMAFKVLWRYVKVIFGLKDAQKSFVVTEHKAPNANENRH